jgi:uncharacterized protein
MNFTVRLNFHSDLGFFLRRRSAQLTIERQLGERTSVKDVVESCGVPHPEVDLILVGDQPVDFAYVLDRDAAIDIYPVGSEVTFFPDNRLQAKEIKKFVADGHLGKLIRDLRLLGIDVLYDSVAEDRQLLELAGAEDRALLTRDRRLLMHAIVRHGYYLRSQDPLEQTIEVLRRFQLPTLAPFARCLRCNAALKSVQKADVIERLEPLTKIYYEQFRQCTGCGQVYWPGSHFEKLETRIQEITQRFAFSVDTKF